MLAEIAQTISARKITRRLRDEDLPAVAGSGDPRGAVDVDPDVALVGQGRLAGVHSHAHANPPFGERVARRGRCGERIGSLRERDEKRIPLCVDLDPAVALKSFAQTPAMLSQHLRIAVAE